MRPLRKKKRTNRRLVTTPRRQVNWRAITRGTAGAVLVAVLIAGSRELLQPQTLPLRALEIEAEFNRVSAADIRAAVAPYTSDGFFGVDVAAARRQVVGLPWVAAAEIRRRWPDSLQVTVYERQPLARWGDAAVLGDDGVLFFPDAANVPDGLPLLHGPEDSEAEVAATFHRMTRALEPLDLGVWQLRLDERRAWRMVLDNGIELVLGRHDADRRMARFVEFYQGTLAARRETARIERVDLRYGNGFAVHWTTAVAQAGRDVS